MKNLYIELRNDDSYIVADSIENFKYSNAFKYLETYNQLDIRNYNNLFKNIDMYSEDELEDLTAFHIVEIEAKGYSQNEYQQWTLYFDKEVLKDSEALEEIKYLSQDLEYYFTEIWLTFNWTIRHEKTIDGEIFTRDENLDSLLYSFTELDEDEVKKQIDEYIKEQGLNKDDYNIIFDIDKIIY